jgi:hypothetical protein
MFNVMKVICKHLVVCSNPDEQIESKEAK